MVKMNIEHLKDSMTSLQLGLISSAIALIGLLVAPLIFAPGATDKSEPAVEEGTHVTLSVSRTVDVPIDTFRAWLDGAALEDILPGSTMIPAVTGTELLAGTWGTPGATRRVLLADGSDALEAITANDWPGYFAYKVWAMAGPGQRLIRYIRGEFLLSPTQDGRTHVEWRYSFRPRTPLAYLHVSAFASLGFKPFLDSGIDAIKQQAEIDQANGSAATN